MTWITEDPTYLIMMGLLLTGFFSLTWFMSQKKAFLLLAIATFLGMIGGIFTERMIVTDREFLRDSVFELALAVSHDDVDRVLEFVSSKTPTTIHRVKSEMPNYEFRSCIIIGINDIDAESYEEIGARAEVEFVVRADVDATRSSFRIDGVGMRKVILTFEKEGEKQWKIVDYTHMDHMSHRPNY